MYIEASQPQTQSQLPSFASVDLQERSLLVMSAIGRFEQVLEAKPFALKFVIPMHLYFAITSKVLHGITAASNRIGKIGLIGACN